MSREESAIVAIVASLPNDAVLEQHRPWATGYAQAALAAADTHDAAHGIHRVSLDDTTVERAARELCSDGDPCDPCLDDARAVLAAAVEAGQ